MLGPRVRLRARRARRSSRRRCSPAASGRGCRSRCSAPRGSGFGAGCLPPAARPPRGLARRGVRRVRRHRVRLRAEPLVLAVHRRARPGLDFVPGRAADREPARTSSRSASRRRSASTSSAPSATSCWSSSSAARSCAPCAARPRKPRSRRPSSSSHRPTLPDAGGRLMEVVLLGTGARTAGPTRSAVRVVRGGPRVRRRPRPDVGARRRRAAARLRAGDARGRRPAPVASLDRVTRRAPHARAPRPLRPVGAALALLGADGRTADGPRPRRGDRRLPRLGRPRPTRWSSARSLAGRRVRTAGPHRARARRDPRRRGPGPGALRRHRPRRRRLLYATDTGWPSAGDPRGAARRSRTTSSCSRRPSATGRPRRRPPHLATFAAPLAGCGPPARSPTRPTVVAIHLGHHNPPPAELDAGWPASARAPGAT